MPKIPESITRQDIIQAIREFNSGAEHEFIDSTEYDLLFERKRYPPKAIIGLAAKRHLGTALKPRDFSGGIDSQCFKVLQSHDFEIVDKHTAWILQGNPDHFDVDQYLKINDYTYWSIRLKSHRKKLAVGDAVFMWRAAGKKKAEAGIIAKGVVVEECKPR